VFSSNASSNFRQMPVTTRSQAKRQQNTPCNHSFPSTSGLQLSSTTFLPTSTCNPSTAASSTVSTCNFTTTALSYIDPEITSPNDHCLQTLDDSSLETSSLQLISKISNLEISNSNVFDPGITMLSCHNSSVSDFLIMEEDCQDCDTVPSVHTKNEDPLDFNQVLSSIANHITTATDKMSSEFNQVMSDNRIFK
jgi:hypothetical protein